jgi:NAD+ synthase
MPESVITKPPTAELKPNQTDQDTLPPYDVLDAILAGIIEGQNSHAEIVAAGYPEALVTRVWNMLDRAEYKRRQSAPGVKLTRRSFGRERRYPITNGYRGG